MKQVDVVKVLEGSSKAIPLTGATENVHWEDGKPTQEKESVSFSVAIPGIPDTCQVKMRYAPGLVDELNSELVIGSPMDLAAIGEVEAITISIYNGALAVRYLLVKAQSGKIRKGGDTN